MNKKELTIPVEFFHTKYKANRYPGNIKGLKHGANCQHFVYELLKYFNFYLPDFRSSGLWKDKKYTRKVKRLKPLDIVFFNKVLDSYGAHIGVYLGDDKVIHLSKSIGYPTVWDFKEFRKHKRYSFFIGAKRIINRYNNHIYVFT